MLRRLTPRQLAFDVVFAALCVAVRLGPFGIFALSEAFVVLCMGAALAMRRLSPSIALGLAWLGALAQMAAGLPPDLSNLAILPVLYATAAYGATRVKWIGLASAGAGALVATAYLFFLPVVMSVSPAAIAVGDLPVTIVGLLLTLAGFTAVFGLSWTLGLLARTRAAARASREAQARAEQEERQARQLAIIEQERNRIARDMHDVVAHSLAVVIAQADGARYAIGGDPDAASEALATISTTARDALADVRVLLTQLRHSQGEGPQPGLDDLERLVAQVRASGLRIREDTAGEPRQLGTAQQLAVYRIVQEALTNALRHGDAAQEVTLALDWGAEAVAIRVSSALRAGEQPVQASLGHGLAGMRERAQLVGGRLAAEPRDGRFCVDARIPFTPEPSTPTREGTTRD
ncbi:sensor histidine kinase [Salinibacterium sp. SYSU T00001]|uniref:sensor histidine kinase n=1 Tax=Homoserinimonas sedimenticola TaxID=2986805 RepID=UPI002235DEF8|nr:sensor histidine kinase [Salinibacterium sedimenticola]MCW4384588.1 sensor histidine kinase [Salinibacterium sedimenticola]